jgi:copper chaperone CopZ
MNETAITFHARGMHCHGCEHVIEAAVRKLAGVRSVSASYPTETVVVDYDADATNFSAIRNSVEQNGYRVVLTEEAQRRRSPFIRLAIIVAALAGLAALILFDTRWISAEGEPDIAQHMSLGLLFLLGLLTGFHCVGRLARSSTTSTTSRRRFMTSSASSLRKSSTATNRFQSTVSAWQPLLPSPTRRKTSTSSILKLLVAAVFIKTAGLPVPLARSIPG